jgi:hypothetical protein
MIEPLPHDAHVVAANALFRGVGWSLDAMRYPRSVGSLALLCELNGITPDKAPLTFGYASNGYMHDWFERLATTKAKGLPIRANSRLLSKAELAA